MKLEDKKIHLMLNPSIQTLKKRRKNRKSNIINLQGKYYQYRFLNNTCIEEKKVV